MKADWEPVDSSRADGGQNYVRLTAPFRVTAR